MIMNTVLLKYALILLTPPPADTPTSLECITRMA